MHHSYALLVNTTDSFSDCWEPFFKLFSIYWTEYEGKIYLNTEYKNYSYKNLNIIPVKGCSVKLCEHKITWSECLKRALESIDNDIVLYMQEDYFLKDTVKNEIVEKYVRLMKEHEDIHCIHLTDQAVIADKKSKDYNGLYTVALKQRYRISCQAALWRKDVLLSYLRPYENAWQFEEFGSRRGAALKHNFYVVDKNWVKLNKFEIIPYIFTGIVQGRWNEEVVSLFAEHGIEIDFTKRGFLKDAVHRSFKQKLQNKMVRIHVLYKYYLDIIKIEFQLQTQRLKR
jgi:hypothetical protein